MPNAFAVSSQTSQNMIDALKVARDKVPDCTAIYDHINNAIAEYETSQREQQELAHYREAAKSQNDVEVDDDALVSKGDEPGAYVASWIWVSDDELS